jgi:histidine ammonia-lyase
VTTGLGAFVNRRVDPSQAAELSRNLILSHSAGLGVPFDRDIVRGAMLLRLNTLAKGFSGVRPEVTDTLVVMLNRGFTPVVPSQGSLGASGDLAPLAHLALAFTADRAGVSPHAYVWYEGEILSAREALERAGITPVRLYPKEGLSLTNGPAFSAALLALDWVDAGRLLAAVEVASAMALEALGAASAAFDARLHLARGHPGQIAVARRLRALTRGSQMLDRNAGLQDAYSLRCIPQILGPVWDAHAFVRGLLTRELNAATDNPLLFDGQAVSGGNFHGAPIALAADLLKTALTSAGALAERQIDRLVSAPLQTGLPPMLVGRPDKAGLQSGLMMLQYTAASLCLENRSLAAPDSVHSLPTSGGQEDLNPNAATAAKNLHQIVHNLRSILAIELMAAAQALDLLSPLAVRKPGHGVHRAHTSIRSRIPFLASDEPLSPLIEAIGLMLRTSDWLP